MPAPAPGRLAVLALTLSAAVAVGQPPAAPPPAAPPPAAPEKPPEPPKLTDKFGGRDADEWLKELKESPDGQVRELAVKTLPLYGPPVRKKALKPLIAAIRDTDSGVRINAIIMLGQIGADTDAEAKEIAEALGIVLSTSGPGAPSRLYAARSLANYGPPAGAALRPLIGIANDPSWETRAAAVTAIARIGAGDPDKNKGPSLEALDALTKRLKAEPSAAVRQAVVDAMISIGPPRPKDPAEYAKQVRPPLDAAQERLKVEKDKTIQVWLQLLVMSYDGTQVTEKNVEKLGKAVSDPDPGVRVAALRALGLLQDNAKPALAMMQDALKMEEPAVVAEAIAALAALEKTAAPAVPALEKVQKEHKVKELQMMAGMAIDTIKGKKPAVPPPPPPAKK